MWKASTTWPRCSVRPRKARRATPTAISSTSRPAATRPPACPGDTASNLEVGHRRRDARVHRHVSGMAKTARDEGFDEIADWFETLARPSARTPTVSRSPQRPRGLSTAAAWPVRQPPPRAQVPAAATALFRGRRRIPPPPALPESPPWPAPRPPRVKAAWRRPRHPLDWKNPDFWNEAALDKELERVFDLCHGCRRCVSLCQSFPVLFDLVDNSPRWKSTAWPSPTTPGRGPVLPV